MTNLIPALDQKVFEKIQTLSQTATVQKALKIIEEEVDFAMQEQIDLCEIPAPTFEESARAQEIAKRMRLYGLTDVSFDEIGNVIGKRPGTKGDKNIVIAAHMDTVFPAGTDVTVKKDGNIYRAPGIGDNCSGLRALLQVLRALEKTGIQTEENLWFVGTVGEEGNGDIRGAKHLVANNKIDAFIAVDSTDVGRVLRGAVGSHRYRITVQGPGGHSFAAFGKTSSAIQAMMRAGAKIADIQVPKEPKTTFTIGTIKGGTSVNTIAAQCQVDIDIRSVANTELEKVEEKVFAAFDQAVTEENARWDIKDEALKVRWSKEQIGNRPAGLRADNCPVLQAARSAQKVLGIELTNYGLSSTDANAPMSRNIPSTCLCSGGNGVGAHTLGEYFEMKDTHLGPQLILLTVLALTG